MKAISAALALVSTVLFTSPAHAIYTEDEAAKILGDMDAADSATAQSTPPHDSATCAKETIDAHKISYCIQSADRTKNPFVIYFFHGLTMNEHRWQTADFSEDLQTIWKAKGLTPPTVISVSFGPVWLLTQARDDKFDFFVEKLMPYLEGKIGGDVSPAHRIAMGESMGGFNVSQLFLKSPTLFSRFVMQCPAVTEVGPFNPIADLVSFVKETGADPKRAVLTKLIGMYEFINQSTWLEHSPIQLATATPSFPTKVYLSCGNHDHYGFYYGVDLMAKLLLDKTQYLQYVYIPGGEHDTVDAQSMADFVSADWSPAP